MNMEIVLSHVIVKEITNSMIGKWIDNLEVINR
jgi:hypothetical protein